LDDHADSQNFKIFGLSSVKIFASSFGCNLANSVRHHGLLLILGAVVFGAGLGLAKFSGRDIASISGVTFIQKYILIAGVWALAGSSLYKLGRMVTIEHPERPLASLWQWFVVSILQPARVQPCQTRNSGLCGIQLGRRDCQLGSGNSVRLF
jgi:hypothetical protein